MKNFCWTLGVLAALCVPSVEAMNREIRALFQPDPAQPNKNEFINKTPNSGYCVNYPSECADNRMFSIRVPIQFQSFRAIRPGEGVAVKVPANWRKLTVTHQDTQETETVEVRIIGIGSRYMLSDSAANLVGVTDLLEGHQKLWSGGSWVYAPSPCLYSGIGGYTPANYTFFWKAPVEAACTKLAQYTIPSMTLDHLDFAYELRTPNPLGMSSGLYNGSLSYFVGPGGDFSMGPMMTPDDYLLTLDFVLDVQHTLKVDLPPGGSKVALEPEGGWQRWIESGRKPSRIYRDQLFYMSASSRFRVMLRCNVAGGDTCSLWNPDYTKRAVVQTKLSLPPGIDGHNGPVKELVLRPNSWLGPFQPGFYVDRKAGSLRFEMTQDSIDFLFRPGFSDTFSGNITVIWDSEV
ncbi:hypothetical protein [Pseudomonas frederiksbergensis]|uniref:Uncharacterized protein n=1 Tax=Pseudomonas frederiksbergensis TaxID=104087 RepID=A0A423HUL4_9PSED|nr:hypothetical protein [Pseudomonas frederiksbergensis]RON16930.1 hypothetical protein BK662_10535 [Pseudomonas frederiksbergensis]